MQHRQGQQGRDGLAVNFYKHYLGDYARDTASLSLLEHGAYRVLLDTYYATEAPLPADKRQLYTITKAMSAAEKRAVDKVVEKFFPVNGDGLRHNQRADKEIADANAYADAQAMRAHMRWHKQGQSLGNANHSHSQSKPTPIPPSGAFLRFWAAWPKGIRKQSQGKCWAVWLKADLDQQAEAILAHVEALKASSDWQREGGRFVPAPLVYLNQRRWEGAEAPQEERRGFVY